MVCFVLVKFPKYKLSRGHYRADINTRIMRGVSKLFATRILVSLIILHPVSVEPILQPLLCIPRLPRYQKELGESRLIITSAFTMGASSSHSVSTFFASVRIDKLLRLLSVAMMSTLWKRRHQLL